MNCPTCYSRRVLHKNIIKGKPKILSLNDYEKIFIDLKKLCKNPKISISGGEPLLYKNIIELVRLAKKYSDNIIIDTNASVLDNKLVDELINSGVTTFYISFMDTTAKQYSINRGISYIYAKSIFNKIQKNILYLNKNYSNKVNISNIIILTKERLLNLDNIILMSKFLGFKKISLDFLESNFTNNNIYQPNINDINEFIRIKYNKLIKYKNNLDYIIKILKQPYYRNSIIDKNCNIPGNFCIILANGDIHQCNILEYSHEKIIGNIFETSLFDLYNNNSFELYNQNRSKYCQYCPINLERTLIL